jgi:hypothetical protein
LVGRVAADDLELEEVRSVADIIPVDKKRQQQDFEDGKDKVNDGNDGMQACSRRGIIWHRWEPAKGLVTPHPSERQWLLSSHDPMPEPGDDEAGSSSNSNTDYKLINNKVDSQDDHREPRPTKQKRQSLSQCPRSASTALSRDIPTNIMHTLNPIGTL